MLRELSQMLIELHDGLVAIEARQGVALSAVEMRLPIELRAVFRDGGCRLLADFARSSGADSWTPLISHLQLQWTLAGAEENAP